MHALEVFNHIAHKVMKDVVSYAHILTNNAYYKDVLGLEMNKKLGSSTIYLTEEQYSQVNISVFLNSIFDIGCHVTHWLHVCSGGDSMVQAPQGGLHGILQVLVFTCFQCKI
jgi:hypothetical protein